MDGWVCRWINDKQAREWIDKLMCRDRMDGQWLAEWLSGRVNGWRVARPMIAVDKWVAEWVDGRIGR